MENPCRMTLAVTPESYRLHKILCDDHIWLFVQYASSCDPPNFEARPAASILNCRPFEGSKP